MSLRMYPALFKRTTTIKKENLERYLNIPDFCITFDYDLLTHIPQLEMYSNDFGVYLIELEITEETEKNILDAIENYEFEESLYGLKSSIDDEIKKEYDELIEAVRYCLENNIEWLQMMVI